MAKKSTTPRTNDARSPKGRKGKPTGKGSKPRKQNAWVRITQKLFGRQIEEKVEKYAVKDPRFYIDERTGKRKERPIPKGLTKDEEDLLAKVRKRAHGLEWSCSCICGAKVGSSALLGFTPEIGAIVDATVGILMVNVQIHKANLGWKKMSKMYLRHVVSEGIGLIPIAGDVWIAYYKVNTRNCMALERELDKRIAQRRGNAGRVLQ
ncbi:uncharacterized protein FOMMEDRAFT_138355 [Fomitiporia mediterranea MF3/22]|uniref:uncharacterized protein n=1 Tax=Fomitiporia mediterranea (strain MF3/22) TaxID=694068 RepID=UPI0004409524|nr:uncharacterized protein FOMMEDRAFT_138355 [Fomitiporia mediterranea MF3/22]EJD06327.1 hypothetical protein FOMMEDRAFT_138355 [Fomitiporia mediterranea MF3/22]